MLYNPAADKPTPIIASITFDGQRHKVYVGTSIIPQHWNKDDQKALTRGYSYTNNSSINEALEDAKTRLLKCYDDYRAVGTLPTLVTLKAVAAPVESAPEPEPTPESADTDPAHARPDLLTTFSNWIENRGLTQSPNTVRTYRTCLRHLRDMQRVERYAIDFDTVSHGFGEKFVRYLLTKRNLIDSVINKNLFRIKHFLVWAQENGYPVVVEPKQFRWQH